MLSFSLIPNGSFSWTLWKTASGYCVTLSFPFQEQSRLKQAIQEILPWPVDRLQFSWDKKESIDLQ